MPFICGVGGRIRMCVLQPCCAVGMPQAPKPVPPPSAVMRWTALQPGQLPAGLSSHTRDAA